MSYGIGVRYQPRVLDAATGRVVRQYPWKKNLVMDKGLDLWAVNGSSFPFLFTYALVGTGTNPTMRYSNPVTVSQTTNTVTASAPFFAASDVGYILKYGAQGSGTGGAEQYITGYTDSQHVTVSSSASVGSTLCAIWYVTQTTLQTYVKSTDTYPATGSGTAWISPNFTYTRVYNFSAETGSVTYNEIGWNTSGSGTAQLFGRDIITPSGVSLVSGQQLQVTIQVQLQLFHVTTQAVGDVSGGTWNTAGNAIIEYLYGSAATYCIITQIAANGNTTGDSPGLGEPSLGSLSLGMIQGNWTQLTTTDNGTNPNGTTETVYSLAAGTYAAGTFTQTFTGTLSLAQGNGVTYYGLGIARSTGNAWTWSLKLTTTNTKDASHTLKFVFTITWGRILSN